MKKNKKRKKKILSLIVSLTMMFSMTGMNMLHAAGTIPTEIWVNGENILLDSDRTLECGSGTAVYEESSNTLILNDAEIAFAYQNESTGIYANGNLNIVVNGNNTITEDGLDNFQTTIGIGIWTTGDLIISGEGSLNINAKDAGVQANSITLRNATISVYCQYNSFWAIGGDIIVSGANITASSNGYPAFWANTNLTIDSGNVNASSIGSNGIGAGGNLYIRGDANVTAQGLYPGLFATQGIFIHGGKVHATGTNDSGIFTNGVLSISGTADVTAIGGLYCGLQADGAIKISGGKVNAVSSMDSAIFSPISITITGSPEVIAEGYLRALQTADLDISGGTINATSSHDSAITAKTRLSITDTADVTANGMVCALLAESIMNLSAKSINAYSKTNYAISNIAHDIIIGGKLIAQSENVYAIYAYGDIITNPLADVTATGGWGGIQAGGDITFTNSIIEAIGYDHDGIYSTGTIAINGGSVHAKGAAGYAAIRAKTVQTADEEAESKIKLSNVIEKNGSKVAYIDWFASGSETKSFTTFISKEDATLHTSMSNALNEVWLSTPYTVTFDVNGGEGDNYSEKVYPNEKVLKPADPIKNGYIFNGWYNGSAVFDFENTAIAADMTLTANWHAHTYGADWKTNATNHWHECACGEHMDNAAHDYSEWIEMKAATESENGRKERICAVCGYRESVEIPIYQKSNSVHTGDSSNLLLTVFAFIVSGGVFVGSIVLNKKKRRFK